MEPVQFTIQSIASSPKFTAAIALQQIDSESVEVTVFVDGRGGDITSVYFDIANDKVEGVSVTGEDVTDVIFSANNVTRVGNARLQAATLPQFDGAVAIGTVTGRDFITYTTFVLHGVTLSDLSEQRFGVRLNSNSRASALLGVAPDLTIPVIVGSAFLSDAGGTEPSNSRKVGLVGVAVGTLIEVSDDALLTGGASDRPGKSTNPMELDQLRQATNPVSGEYSGANLIAMGISTVPTTVDLTPASTLFVSPPSSPGESSPVIF